MKIIHFLRLMIAFAILGMIIVSGISFYALFNITGQSEALVSIKMPSLAEMSHTRENINKSLNDLSALNNIYDNNEIVRNAENIDQEIKSLKVEIQNLHNSIPQEFTAHKVQSIERILDNWIANNQMVFKAAKDYQHQEIPGIIEKYISPLSEQIHSELSLIQERVILSGHGIKAVANKTIQIQAIISILTTLLVAGTSTYLGQAKLLKPLKKTSQKLRDTAYNIGNKSRQITSLSCDLERCSESQSNSINDTTGSISNILTATNQSLQNGEKASSVASMTHKAAAQGNERMKDLVETVETIESTSQNTFKIMKSIDEIAFQTNILALNAAVEAARAGEHGGGFAVVAEEVRQLATRSAIAAKESSDILKQTLSKSSEGAELCKEVANDLSMILEQAMSLDEISSELVETMTDQNQNIDQLHCSFETFNSITTELVGQSRDLKETFFVLNEGSEHMDDAIITLTHMISGKQKFKKASKAKTESFSTKAILQSNMLGNVLLREEAESAL